LTRSPAWWQAGSFLAAALVVVVVLVDQLPPAPGRAKQERIAQHLAADRELGTSLEGRLPKGAMVFQLSVMMFPDFGSRGQLGDYEHCRPFLATSSLRFNDGALLLAWCAVRRAALGLRSGRGFLLSNRSSVTLNPRRAA
jgi:hypothetical protein